MGNPVLAGAGPFIGSYECFASGAQSSLTTHPDAPMPIGGIRLVTITVTDASMPSITISDDDGSTFTPVSTGIPNESQYKCTSLSARAKGGNKVTVSWATPAHNPQIVIEDFLPNNTGTAQYIGLAAMPAHDGTPATSWLTGEIAIVKDGGVGDLVAFFQGNTALHAAVSQDDGSTWSWVDGTGVNLGAQTGAIYQDENQKIHIVYQQVGQIGYARITLTRNSVGHVTGFTADVSNVGLPASVNTSGFVRTQIIAGRDSSENPTLVYVIYDENGVGGRIQAGKTSVAAGWTPSAGSDFVTLANGVGATTVQILPFVNGFEGSHNCSCHLAQHPVSRDLWFQWGPIDTGDGIGGNVNPIKRLRATPSGTTWVLGTPVTVASFSTTAAEIASVYVTPSFVWLMHFDPTNGLTIDKAAADGTITNDALPSPLAVAGTGGYFSLAVDPLTENIAYVGGWISSDSVGGPDFWAKYYNGSTWTKFNQTSPPSDTNGVGHSIAWIYGLALVQVDATSNGAWMATIRTV